MKRDEESHRQAPSRKSPRLSSVPSAEFIAKPRSTHKIRSDEDASDSWALSLHDLDPVPLQICLPFEEDNISPRRSSRFTANKYRTPMQKRGSVKVGAICALDSPQLRRSPRFSSPSSSIPALTSRNVKIAERHSSEGKEATIGPPSKRVNTLSALAEPGSGHLNKRSVITKCLRSRTLIMIVGNEEWATGGIDSEETDGDYLIMSEKCLRSRRIKYPLIESPRSLENKVSRRNQMYTRSNVALLEPPPVRKNVSVQNLVDSPQNLGKDLNRSQTRSPRLNLSLLEPASVQKNDCVEKCLRSRNVVMNVGKVREEEKAPGAYMVGSRSSPRPNGESDDENMKHGILALPVQIPSIKKTSLFIEKSFEEGVAQETVKSTCNAVLGDNCLRSLQIKALLDELFDDSEFMDLEKCDSRVISERSLRSRNIQSKVDDTERAEKNFVPIEGNELKAEKT